MFICLSTIPNYNYLVAEKVMLAKDNSIQSTGLALMDEARSLLLLGKVQEAMDLVFSGMKRIKENLNQFEWEQFAKTTCLEHSLIDLVHQCPFTYHASNYRTKSCKSREEGVL